MLYWLTALSDGGDFFNLFRYITFRAGGAFLTALVFGFLFGRPLINVLRRRQGKGQPIRGDGPEGHFAKAGTPTMGGLLIVGALVTATLLWARLDNPFVWLVLFVTLSFAADRLRRRLCQGLQADHARACPASCGCCSASSSR